MGHLQDPKIQMILMSLDCQPELGGRGGACKSLSRSLCDESLLQVVADDGLPLFLRSPGRLHKGRQIEHTYPHSKSMDVHGNIWKSMDIIGFLKFPLICMDINDFMISMQVNRNP